MENELQLLVVDFGNCCAVRVEKGRVEFIDVDGSKVSLIAGGPISPAEYKIPFETKTNEH